ncbi:unnamed protein product, partial [Oppiella nova]
MNQDELNTKDYNIETNVKEIDDKHDVKESEEQDYINKYLLTHPAFGKEWLMKNITHDLIKEWFCRQSSETNILCDNWSSKECIERQTSDANQLPTNDEELLTASYAEIAKEGRNSVTSDLFHQIVECGPRKTTRVINTSGDRVVRDELEDKLQ